MAFLRPQIMAFTTCICVRSNIWGSGNVLVLLTSSALAYLTESVSADIPAEAILATDWFSRYSLSVPSIETFCCKFELGLNFATPLRRRSIKQVGLRTAFSEQKAKISLGGVVGLWRCFCHSISCSLPNIAVSGTQSVTPLFSMCTSCETGILPA